MVSSKRKEVKTFFSENSIFDKKVKPKLGDILGSDYKLKDEHESSYKESIGVQCSLPIVENIKLSTNMNSNDIEKYCK